MENYIRSAAFNILEGKLQGTMEFGPGLNVLTGETGAGKSLVATAVHLVLGRKAGPDVVRRGAEIADSTATKP